MIHHASKKNDFLIFIHQPKAAGTTLTSIIRNQFRKGELFEIDGSNPGRSQAEFLQLPRETRGRFKAISGHMYFGLHEKLETQSKYITMLRNPVSRIISLYNFIKSKKNHYAHGTITSNNITLHDFVQNNIIDEIENNQTKRFSGIHNIHPSEEKKILALAKSNIENNFLLAGISEKFDEFLLVLKMLLNWDSIFYAKLNTTPKNDASDICDSTISLIKERNRLDIELYEFTSRLLDSKIASFGPTFDAHLRFFQIINRMPTSSPSAHDMRAPSIQDRIQAVLTDMTTLPVSENDRHELRFITTYLQQHRTESPFFNTGTPQHSPEISDSKTPLVSVDTRPRRQLLNLGCGRRFHAAWINIDFSSSSPNVIQHDLSTGIPFEDNSCDVVYHSHLLEHFTKEHAPKFLKDCFRVLKPGGTIRVAIPDLETIIRLYLVLLEKSLRGDLEAQYRYDWITLELFDQMARNTPGGDMLKYWKQNPMPVEDFVTARMGSEVRDIIRELRFGGKTAAPQIRPSASDIGSFRLSGEVHQWMYDRFSLARLLGHAGFQDIRTCKADQSAIPGFNSFFLDIEEDGSPRKPDSLYMEATKPEPR